MEGEEFTSVREHPPAIRTVGSVSDNFIHCVGYVINVVTR